MRKSTFKLGVLGLLTIALACAQTPLRAQNTNKPAADQNQTKEKKPKSLPFNGKLKAVDNTAKTISVGKLVLQVSSETKILKDEKPATLADGIVDEQVSGAYMKSDDGKLIATKVTFGKKAGTKEKTMKDKTE
jgi:hypothetical protein